MILTSYKPVNDIVVLLGGKYGMYKEKRRDAKGADLEEEFRVLVKNLVPMTEEQTKWIWSEVERLTYEHPELKEKLDEWSTTPDLEREALEKMLDYVKSHCLKDPPSGVCER